VARAFLPVVLLAVDVLALLVLAVLNPALFFRPYVAVGACPALRPADAGLPPFEIAGFLVRELAGPDALLDSLLLIDVALHVGLHPLARRRAGITTLRIVLLAVDVLTHLVLRLPDARLLLGRQLPVPQRVGLHLLDARLFTLQARGFLRRKRTRFQSLLDSLLLVDVALAFRSCRLRKHRCRDSNGDSAGRKKRRQFHDLSPWSVVMGVMLCAY